MPNDRGVVRGHTPTIGTNRVEGGRASLASSCPLPRHATFVLCVPGVRASSTFDSRARHPRLTSHCRCRGNALRAGLESLMTLKLGHIAGGRGLAAHTSAHNAGVFLERPETYESGEVFECPHAHQCPGGGS